MVLGDKIQKFIKDYWEIEPVNYIIFYLLYFQSVYDRNIYCTIYSKNKHKTKMLVKFDIKNLSSKMSQEDQQYRDFLERDIFDDLDLKMESD